MKAQILPLSSALRCVMSIHKIQTFPINYFLNSNDATKELYVPLVSLELDTT